MSHPEIFLEHRGQGTSVRRRRVTSQTPVYVIGSSKSADLRILDQSIAGCHAVLQFRDSDWYIRNVTVDGPELRLNNEPVVEAKLTAESMIQIGVHRIRLFSPHRSEGLFREVADTTGELSHHLVVVKDARGRVVKVSILAKTQSFYLADRELLAPSHADWVETRFGNRVIQQRLITSREAARAEGMQVDKDIKKPLFIALLVFLLIMSAALFIPKASIEKPELALDQKSIDMIFNAEAVKKKRQESKKVTQTAKARAGGISNAAPLNTSVVAPEVSAAPTKSSKASAALTSIRNAGLSSLVGKIAKRANKNSVLVAAQGVSPDVKGAGRAFFSSGTATTGGGGVAAVAGKTYRIGGVATNGRGGGASGFRDGTALAGGAVGTGQVALVDEETVIEGGLDRDVIAEVIRRNLGQIRYCYERQLSSNPDLYGKLLVRFTIDARGSLIEPKIDSTTLKSSLVEGCVLRRMAGWQFPLPKGGTQVRVSYPFLFKALD
jgi:outer membrane biosynthesis protein TonB